MSVNLGLLRHLLGDRDCQYSYVGGELFCTFMVDGKPTTVPQTVDLSNGFQARLIVEALNALPALLRVARAADYMRDYGGTVGSDVSQLFEAVDAMRGV